MLIVGFTKSCFKVWKKFKNPWFIGLSDIWLVGWMDRYVWNGTCNNLHLVYSIYFILNKLLFVRILYMHMLVLTGPLFLLSNIPAPVQGENLNDRALTSLSPAQRLMKAFWNSTPEMKDIEREKREISLWLPQTHVCLVLSLFTRFGSFSLSAVCVKDSRGKKKKITFVGACTTLISIFLAEGFQTPGHFQLCV